MKLNMIMKVVLTTLGASKFLKNDQGNLDLSDEHKKTLAGVFGQPFVDMFSKQLNAQKAEDDAAADLANPSAAAADTTDIMGALAAHHATVVANGVKDIQAQLTSEQNKSRSLQEMVNAMADAPEHLPIAEKLALGANGAKAKKFRVNAKNPLYVAANAYLETADPHAFSAATIEVQELNAEFGTFLSQDQNNLEIKKKLFTGFTSAKFFTVIRATTEYRAIRSMITSVAQQFTAKWTPSKGAGFKPMKIINFRHKINFPIIPAEVLTGYMFKLYDESKSPDQMPVTNYIWNELIEPALLQDIEMRMAWKAKFVDNSLTQDENDAATPPEESMNGIETIIAEAKISGDTGMHFFRPNSTFSFQEQADLGNWQAILDFVSDYVAWLSPWYKTTLMPLFLSPDNIRIYQVAYKKVWGTNSGQDGDFGTKRVDFSNQMLTAPDGMFNSAIIFSTPKANMIMLRHINELPNIINDVQKHGYEVRIFGEFWMGVGFLYPAAVFAFCPNGYVPSDVVAETLGDFDSFQEDYNNGDGESQLVADGI